MSDFEWVKNAPDVQLREYVRFNAGLRDRLSLQAAEIDELKSEVREWLCDKCNTVYPGPPRYDIGCALCPKCDGNTAPRMSVELRRANKRIAEMENELRFKAEQIRNQATEIENCTHIQAERDRLATEFGDVYEAVRAERRRQDEQWGGPGHDDSHDWYNWSHYISSQLSRLIRASTKSDEDERRERFIKIAALAIAAVESGDRRANLIATTGAKK